VTVASRHIGIVVERDHCVVGIISSGAASMNATRHENGRPSGLRFP
jgi:hypothetical protein